MLTSDLVRQLCGELHISLAELARRLGQSPQNFSKKIVRDTLTLRELQDIAELTGCEFVQSFSMPGDKVIVGNCEGIHTVEGCCSIEQKVAIHLHVAEKLCGDYACMYRVDLNTGDYEVFRDDYKLKDKLESLRCGQNFFRCAEKLIESEKSLQNKAIVKQKFNCEAIAHALSKDPAYFVNCSFMYGDGRADYQVKVVKAGTFCKDSVALGIYKIS